MRTITIALIGACWYCVLCCQTVADTVADYDIAPNDTFTKAAFRIWAPSIKETVRGVVVLVPGVNGDGRGMTNDRQWRELAAHYQLIVVGCFFQGNGDYYDASKGSGLALLRALVKFSQDYNRAEIPTAPLLLYGESAGGQYNYNFVLWQPGQVMAFVVNKGGYYPDTPPSEDARSVPGLFFLGLDDSQDRIQAITRVWKAGRGNGALWALAPQPESGHEFSRTAELARVFFDAVLKRRLLDNGAAPTGDRIMQSMKESDGWIGDATMYEIHAADVNNLESDKSWLPDQSTAETWRDFVSGRK